MPCANMDLMSEVQERNARALRERADALVASEGETARLRDLLHQAIRDAADPALDEDDRMGPSAIARATGHKYTREYVTELLKKAFGSKQPAGGPRRNPNAARRPRQPGADT